MAEYVTFARVRYVRREVLAHHAVPVGRIFFVKETLNVLGDLLLSVLLVHDLVNLLLEVALHFLTHLAHHPLYCSLRCHVSIYYLNN